MPSFLLFVITVCALVSWDSYRESEATVRAGIIIAAGVGLFATVVHQLVLWRRGDLILLDRERRERNRRRVQEVGVPLGYAAGGVLVAVAYLLGDAKGVLLAFIGGVIAGYTPLLLWIAFVIRPDRQTGSGKPVRD